MSLRMLTRWSWDFIIIVLESRELRNREKVSEWKKRKKRKERKKKVSLKVLSRVFWVRLEQKEKQFYWKHKNTHTHTYILLPPL